jgi:hypothetical protein
MRLPGLAHNRLTYVGVLIAMLAASAIVFLLFYATLTGGDAPYGAVIIFLLLPAVVVLGILIAPFGMLLERRHVRRTGRPSMVAFPVVDLNHATHRARTVAAAVVGLALMFGVNFASYLAYEHTESVSFCGQICHTTMQPEAVAHQHSPHARTACVACHVGPGSQAFIAAKLSGLRQVRSVLLEHVPKPIPVPIANLRPAAETCQGCHWPEQFFVPQYRRFVHFAEDEESSRWEIHLRLLTGGGGPHLPGALGIHAHHSGVNKKIEYIASDRERTEIRWVRVTDRASGLVTEYLANGGERPDATIESGAARVMDCLDCHNRPAHRYNSPHFSINVALATGKISLTLPSIKRIGIEVLTADYETTEEATGRIATDVKAFYADKHPDVFTARSADIASAVYQLQTIYQRNFFPRMKVRWDTYPDHSAHMNSPGCFRCHAGNHVSAAGEMLTNDCRTCHAIVAQGVEDAMEHATDIEGLDFAHPGDIGDLWQDMLCTDCHAEGT